MSNDKKTIIVGGGISGLVAASLLAKNGIEVVLLEKNKTVGGCVNSFTEEGFIFDGGIRAIENAGMIIPMLKELEIDLPLLPSKVSVGIEDKVIHAVSEESINDYESLLKQIYPESYTDVEKVIGVIKDFNEYMKVLFGDESPFYKDKKKHKKYYVTTFFSWFIKFIKTGIAITKMKIPVEDFLHKLISDDSLFDIISQHFFKKTPAFFAMSYFSLYPDYYYPKGGVGQLTAKLKQRITDYGGTVLCNTEITQVDIASHVLTDTSGNSHQYNTLIWCADSKTLYSSIVNIDQIRQDKVSKAKKEQARILSSKGAESVYSLFLGINEPTQYFQAVSHGHFFYTPSRKGLGSIHREDLKKLLSNWDSVSKDELFSWLYSFCELNTFEVSIPALHDPDTAPEGKTGLIISLLMDHELMVKIQDSGWYDESRKYINEAIIDIFNNYIYPGIKGKIIYVKSSTPLTIEKLVGSSEGAIVGWSFENEIPIDAGMLNMKKAVLTALPDIYRAGQWTASPAGLPTCIMTAKMAADRVLKDV